VDTGVDAPCKVKGNPHSVTNLINMRSLLGKRSLSFKSYQDYYSLLLRLLHICFHLRGLFTTEGASGATATLACTFSGHNGPKTELHGLRIGCTWPEQCK
jgi:hypothetical protein